MFIASFPTNCLDKSPKHASPGADDVDSRLVMKLTAKGLGMLTDYPNQSPRTFRTCLSGEVDRS